MMQNRRLDCGYQKMKFAIASVGIEEPDTGSIKRSHIINCEALI